MRGRRDNQAYPFKAWQIFLKGKEEINFFAKEQPSQGCSFLFLSEEEKMRRQKQKGQSILEYILVWTAIVGAVIIAAATIKNKIESSYGNNSSGSSSLTGKIETGFTNFTSSLAP
jgi:hypothetical protein